MVWDTNRKGWAPFHLGLRVMTGKEMFSLKLGIFLTQGRGMPVHKLSLELTHPGPDKCIGVLVPLVQALARARLLFRDRGMEVLGMPLMQPLLIKMP